MSDALSVLRTSWGRSVQYPSPYYSRANEEGVLWFNEDVECGRQLVLPAGSGAKGAESSGATSVSLPLNIPPVRSEKCVWLKQVAVLATDRPRGQRDTLRCPSSVGGMRARSGMQSGRSLAHSTMGE